MAKGEKLPVVMASQVGQPSGVAGLDESGKVPHAQLPAMGYIPTTEKGQPGGVATLGPDGKVPGEQLPKMDYDPAGSAEAVQKLDALGYSNLYDLGGILSWPYEIEGDFEGHF